LGLLPLAASTDWTESYAAVLTVCCGLAFICGAAAFVVHWAIPLDIGIPLIVRALLWHPLSRARTEVSS
jgi:hypothetical protein